MCDKISCRFQYIRAILLAAGICFSPTLARATDITEFRSEEKRSRAVFERIVNATVGLVRGSENGSGVIVSADGLIMTAAHVISHPGMELTVVLADGRLAKAKALGCDYMQDAGLAQITDVGKWPFAEKVQATDLKPGTWCLAVGHPGGPQPGRRPLVRLGRVLALLNESDPTGTINRARIVTDATIGPGDSGGPLFDLDGKVIGIHTNIGLDARRDNRHAPMDSFLSHWDDLVQGKELNKPVQDKRVEKKSDSKDGSKKGSSEDQKTSELARAELGIVLAAQEAGEGRVTVQGIKPGSSAADAGLKSGDVITALDDEAITDPLALAIKLTTFPLGRQIKLDLERCGKKIRIVATLKRRELSLQELFKQLSMLLNNPDSVSPDKIEQILEACERAKKAGIVFNIQSASGGDLKFGKFEKTLLSGLADVTSKTSRSIAVVLCDNKAVALGTVVRKKGYILTKASELSGQIKCRISGRELPAVVVDRDQEYDLALLRVEADDLIPIAWSNDTKIPDGTWLITPDAEGKPLAPGILGHAPRKIARISEVFLGVSFDPNKQNAVVLDVAANSPAREAGLRPNDVIVSLDGQSTPNNSTLTEQLGMHKPGDKVSIKVKRKNQTLQMTATLTAAVQNRIAKVDFLSFFGSLMGNSLSERRTGFPAVFTHDAVIAANQCGGPIMDLDGRVVGLNIARADRTATYALPSAILPKLVTNLLAEEGAPEAERTAIQAVKKSGGKVIRKADDQPVVEVDFSGRQGQVIMDASLKELKAFPKLNTLNLNGTLVTDAGLKEIKELESLQVLRLTGCAQVTDAGLKDLKELKQLKELRLGGTQVTDAGLEYIGSITNLQILGLAGTKVTDSGLKNLRKLKSLKELVLESTLVTPVGMAEIRKALPKLKIVAAIEI